MNRDQKHGDWMQASGKLREKWGKLTDDDQMVIAGRRDQLAGLLQKRRGDAAEKAEKRLDLFN